MKKYIALFAGQRRERTRWGSMRLNKRHAFWIAGCLVALGTGTWAATSNFLILNARVDHSEFFDGPATMSVRELTLEPGEVTPWHYHPGVVLVAVKSGALTREVGCGAERTYVAGEAFEEFDSDIHRAKNPTSEPIVVYDIFMIPQGQPQTVVTPNNERLCGPPANVASCRNGAWSNFTFPRLFENQGDCEQYVITGK
jgi:quercetin dioxygenase-like cupin family protein